MPPSLAKSEPSPRDERPPADPPPPRPLPWWRWTASAVVGAGLGAALVLALTVWGYSRQLPAHLDALSHWKPSILSEVYSSDGELIGEFYLQRRIPLGDLRKIPPHVRDAFLAAEDGRFYQHPGLDPSGIFRALYSNLVAGRVVQGGSTITQQVVKNLMLTPERSLERKVKEAILSIRVEHELSKDEILTIYLDMIYLGHGAYGIQAAAQAYFGKDARDLTIAEAALLAGMVKAPSANSPFRRFDKAKARQLYVLDQLEALGMISREEGDVARSEPLTFLAAPSVNNAAAPEYVEQVRRAIQERYRGDLLYQGGLRITAAVDMGLQRQARLAVRAGVDALEARRGFQGPDSVLPQSRWDAHREAIWREIEALRVMDGRQKERGQPPVTGEVYSALVIAHGVAGVLVAVGPWEGVLDPEDLKGRVSRLDPAGKMTTVKVADVLPPGSLINVRWLGPGPDGRHQATLKGAPSGQAALLALDPSTGLVRAMVGAYDARLSRFNRATQGRRQPGSTFKAFIYAAAIAAGHSQIEILRDAPVTFRMAGGRFWSPGNYGDRFLGPVTLRTALSKSLNSVALKLMDQVGTERVIALVRRMGVESPLVSNLTLGLGTSELTLSELTRGYASFAAGGRVVTPLFVEKVETLTGQVLEDHSRSASPPPAPLPGLLPPGYALDPASAFVMADMLQAVVEDGTGRGARGLGRPTAGKTGTTNDFRDAWFVGFTPELTCGVWIGNDGHHPMGPSETGGSAAVPIWKAFMDHAVAGLPPSEFTLPPGVIYLRADPRTGKVEPGSSAGRWLPFRLQDVPASWLPREVGVDLADQGI